MSSSTPSPALSASLRDRALSLLPIDYRDFEALQASCAVHRKRTIDPAVIALVRQSTEMAGMTPCRESNLQALASGALAVITGQQTGLFLGPLYTLYKALAAIEYARSLGERFGIRAVPVFWLQTEDHDFAEIASCTLPSETSAPLIVTAESDSPRERRISVAHRHLSAGITEVAARVSAELDPLPYAEEILPALVASYRPGAAFPDAFARLLASVFAHEGLLFFNPRTAAASALFAPFFARAIERDREITSALIEQGKRLDALEIPQQVHIREDSPLIFLHTPDAEGERFRLTRDGATYSLQGEHGTFSCRDLLELIQTAPHRFTSSALLRPLVQDSLFPTAAYIGGDAELRYYAQLDPLYDLFEVPRHPIVPRQSFLLIEPKARSLLRRLALNPPDLALPVEELERRLLSHAPTASPDFGTKTAELAAPLFRYLDTELPLRDPTLAASWQRRKKRIEGHLQALERGYLRAAAFADRTTADRLNRLQALLRPQGHEQERVYSAPYYLAQYGRRLLERLRDSFDPLLPGKSTVELD